MSGVYLVKRGPRPSYHKAPFHPVIICGKRRVAMWEAGFSGDCAWVWEHNRGTGFGGWLFVRWAGLDIDYGHVVRNFTLPDGTDAAFVHEHTGREPWFLIAGAVWWDDKRMPKWLEASGVVYPSDHHSQQSILNVIADSGFLERPTPNFWPKALRAPTQAAHGADNETEGA